MILCCIKHYFILCFENVTVQKPLPSLPPLLCTSFTLALLINQAIAIRVPALRPRRELVEHEAGPSHAGSGCPSQPVPSGVGVAECLAPVPTVRLADRTTAGSPLPEPPRSRSRGAGVLEGRGWLWGLSSRPRHQHCSQLVYSGKRSITSAMAVLVGRDW